MKKKVEDVGLIVGRFQTYRLHKAHLELIETVSKKHHKTIIMLGVAELGFTQQDPLDFQSRKEMLKETFPNANIEILPIYDCKDDYVWSAKLDNEIQKLCRNATVKLYGGSDSCIERYHGNLPTEKFTTKNFERATDIRSSINSNFEINQEFRKGIIFTVQNQYPRVDPCADVLIINADTKELLLGKKGIDGDCYRFIGGYFDPRFDKSIEDTAIREVKEEAGVNVEISNLKYISSSIIDDWRYHGRKEKLLSTFFIAYYMFGNIQPGDDLDGLLWVPIETFIKAPKLIKEHRVFLTEKLISKLK